MRIQLDCTSRQVCSLESSIIMVACYSQKHDICGWLYAAPGCTATLGHSLFWLCRNVVLMIKQLGPMLFWQVYSVKCIQFIAKKPLTSYLTIPRIYSSCFPSSNQLHNKGRHLLTVMSLFITAGNP